MVSYGALKAVCKAGDDVERQRSALKRLFGSFVKCDKNVVRTQVCMYVGTAVCNMLREGGMQGRTMKTTTRTTLYSSGDVDVLRCL